MFFQQPDLSKKIDTTNTVLYPVAESIPYSFPLDPFQQYAVSAIHQGHNVLVCAKTGSGKTLVGEYQIHHSIAKSRRVFYTTPIKSLSNQKFSDLKTLFPSSSVGIMTGDIKFRPDADIVVMTTEILRNLLYKQGTATASLGLSASLSLEGLDAVIFDECHYINDPDRGKVWEETMILLPPTVKLILLSATLNKPEFFAQWLGDLKKVPVHLIQTSYRIVPLTHAVINGEGTAFITTMTPGTELYQDKAYRDWLAGRKAIEDGHKHFKDKVHAAYATGTKGGVAGKVRAKSFVHQLNETIALLQSRVCLPALFFVFSRKGCEDYASKVSHTLLDGGEQSNVRHIMDFHLHTYKSSLETLPQYHVLRDLLLKGVAFHHSGLLPVLKEIVELLFTKGFVRILFATETFAVGLNMPTKTVVFTGLKKYDDGCEGMRLLRTDEYIQMAGRAGRRGKDTEGLVLYLPDREPVEPSELHQIMCGGRQSVQSRMDFHYDFLLKTLQSGSHSWLGLMEQSYWFRQRSTHKEQTAREISELQTQIGDLKGMDGTLLTLCEQKDRLELALRQASGNKRKAPQKELERWNAAHAEQMPAIVAAMNRWIALQPLERTLKAALEDLVALEAHASCVSPQLDFLRQANYLTPEVVSAADLTSKNLTLRGILATEVNEAHPLLLTELFLSKKAHSLEGANLAALLSVFMEDYNKEYVSSSADVPEPTLREPLLELETVSKSLQAYEHACSRNPLSSDKFWNLSLQWIEPIYRWITERDTIHLATIRSDYGLFEGNFVRGLLKLANILDEWLSLATFCEHADQIEKITALRPLIVRGLAMPDSLYLR